ncbi:hypothetical protein C0J52_26141 [Blattella germanica]|nr:hypothetical protein C0J52_26141 [Blattella germanica]
MFTQEWKNVDKTEVSNYRTVSLTSVVCISINSWVISINSWFYDSQYGFSAGFSCDGNYRVDNGERIDEVVIVFSKAFDLVTYGKLLESIINMGIDRRIQNFLDTLSQRVKVGQ